VNALNRNSISLTHKDYAHIKHYKLLLLILPRLTLMYPEGVWEFKTLGNLRHLIHHSLAGFSDIDKIFFQDF